MLQIAGEDWGAEGRRDRFGLVCLCACPVGRARHRKGRSLEDSFTLTRQWLAMLVLSLSEKSLRAIVGSACKITSQIPEMCGPRWQREPFIPAFGRMF